MLYLDVFINRQTHAGNCVWLLINTSRYLCFDSFSFVVMVSCVFLNQSCVFLEFSGLDHNDLVRVCVFMCLRVYASACSCVCVSLDHNDLEAPSRSCLRVYVSACLCVCMIMCLRVYVQACLSIMMISRLGLVTLRVDLQQQWHDFTDMCVCIYLSIYQSIYLYIRTYIYVYMYM